MERNILFEGEPLPQGGLSNARVLAELCSQSFRSNCEWTLYAREVIRRGGDLRNWRYLAEDPAVRERQFRLFCALLGSHNIPPERRATVAGWMLSHMLTEIPEYLSIEAAERHTRQRSSSWGMA